MFTKTSENSSRISVLEARFNDFHTEITKQWSAQSQENKELRKLLRDELHNFTQHIDKVLELKSKEDQKFYIGSVEHHEDMNKIGEYTRKQTANIEERLAKKFVFYMRIVVSAFLAGFGVFIYLSDFFKS